MDTTDKQNPQSVTLSPEEEKEIARIFRNNLDYGNPTSLQDHVTFGNFWLKEHMMQAARDIVARERQRLRDAVNERKRTYFNRIQRHHQSDGKWLLEIFAKGEDECEWFLSLLENPEPHKEP